MRKNNKFNLSKIFPLIFISIIILSVMCTVALIRENTQNKNIRKQKIITEGKECYILLLNSRPNNNYNGMILDSSSLLTVKNTIFEDGFVLDTENEFLENALKLGDNFEEQNVAVDTSFMIYEGLFMYLDDSFGFPINSLYQCYFYKGIFYAIEPMQI